MKKMIFLIAAAFLSLASFAQNNIPVDSVAGHVGENVIICSKVYGVKQLEKICFLNIGAAYPNAPLTAVIFEKDFANFPAGITETYNNKSVCIKAVVSEFKGKIQVVISNPSDITVE